MPNRNEKQFLQSGKDSEARQEMMRHEVEKRLNQEMAKPAKEIDADLVSLLASLLEPAHLSEEERNEIWRNISERIDSKRQRKHVYQVLGRVAAVLVAVIGIFAVTLATSKAFQWTFLLRILEPIAQTFGITSVEQNAQIEQEPSNYEMFAPDDVSMDQYVSLDGVPSKVEEYTIIPQWLPEGYSFTSGHRYMDSTIAAYNLLFTNADDWISVDVSIFADESIKSNYRYEIFGTVKRIVSINGIETAIYENGDDDNIRFISVIYKNAHYLLQGTFSEDELIRIAEGLLR